MVHRPPLAAAFAACALIAAPAAAQPESARVAESLSDPRLQSAAAAAARAMSEAMLDLRVAPLVKAAEALRDPEFARAVDPDLTLGEIAGPRAAQVPDELSRRVPGMMGAMGAMAGTVDAMAPALMEMAREMGVAMSRAIDQAHPGGDRRDRDAIPGRLGE